MSKWIWTKFVLSQKSEELNTLKQKESLPNSDEEQFYYYSQVSRFMLCAQRDFGIRRPESFCFNKNKTCGPDDSLVIILQSFGKNELFNYILFVQEWSFGTFFKSTSPLIWISHIEETTNMQHDYFTLKQLRLASLKMTSVSMWPQAQNSDICPLYDSWD